MKLKIIHFIVIHLLIITLGYSAQDHCEQSINNLFKDNKYSNSVNKLLKLQGKLTLHRLSWALTNKSEGVENFKIEKKIDSILQKIENNNDPSFQSAYKQFKRNKLSRTALAEIIPFIKDILNEQNSISDPIKRAKFIIQDSDIKLLAILAENERTNSDGTFNDSLLSNKDSIGSVLNFTKIINSSLRERKINKSFKSTMDIQINLLSNQINKIINNLPISSYCKQILLQSCKENSADESIYSSNIFSIIESLEKYDQQKQLKYGDFWLHVGKKNDNLIPNENIKEQEYNLPEETLPVANKESEYLNKLASYVLDNYPYFLTRNELLENEEILMSLVHSIDNKLKSFVYKNKEYILPESYNPIQFKEKGEEIYNRTFTSISITPTDRKLNLPHVQLIDKKRRKLRELKELIPSYIKSEKQRDEFYYTLIAANEEVPTLTTFDFRGTIYDTKTGKKIPRSLEGLLSYPINETAVNARFIPLEDIPVNQKEVILDDVASDNEYYIAENKLYSISNTPVALENVNNLKMQELSEVSINESVDKDIATNKVALAILNDQNVVKIGSNVYNPITLESYSYKEQETLLSTFQQSNNVQVTPPLSLNYNKRQEWFSSVMNNQDTFNYNGKIYSSITTEEISSPIGSINNNFYNHDKYLEIEHELNKLPDKELVIEFNKKFENKSNCNYYTVVDKKKQTLEVYNKEGSKLFSKEILLGDIKSDKRTIFYSENYPKERTTNKTTSAGIFYAQDFRNNKDDEYYNFFNNNILALVTEKGSFSGPLNENGDYETILALHQTPVGYEHRNSLFNNQSMSDNRATNGCLNMLPKDFEEYKRKFPQMGCPIYILPEEDNNRMMVKNGKINFVPKTMEDCDSGSICNEDYYFSPQLEEESKDISIAIMNPSRSNNQNIDIFIKTLEDNKKELIEKLNISNSEYNSFAKLAYAIFGVESQFGDSRRYKVKEGRLLASDEEQTSFFSRMKSWISKNITQELGQTLVTTAKTIDGNDSNNSRGLTQIKDITEYTQNFYPHITEDNLVEPENAALATIIVLKSMNDRLKRVQKNHNNINADNYDEFLYYIYNGASSLIKNGNATPELNIKTRRLKTYLDEIIVYQQK